MKLLKNLIILDLVFNALSKFDEATSREFISDSMQTLRFDENALAAMGLSDYGELKVDVYGSGLGTPLTDGNFWISYIDAEIMSNIPYNGGYDYWNGHKRHLSLILIFVFPMAGLITYISKSSF